MTVSTDSTFTNKPKCPALILLLSAPLEKGNDEPLGPEHLSACISVRQGFTMLCISTHFYVSLIHHIFSAHKSKPFLKCIETEHIYTHIYLIKLMTYCAATMGDDRLFLCTTEQKALTTFLLHIYNSSITIPKSWYSCAWIHSLCACIPKKNKK